jgi:hypothetical protein
MRVRENWCRECTARRRWPNARVTPHGHEARGREYARLRVALRDGEGDVGFPEPDIVREQGTTVAMQQGVQSLHGIGLMRVQRDRAGVCGAGRRCSGKAEAGATECAQDSREGVVTHVATRGVG